MCYAKLLLCCVVLCCVLSIPSHLIIMSNVSIITVNYCKHFTTHTHTHVHTHTMANIMMLIYYKHFDTHTHTHQVLKIPYASIVTTDPFDTLTLLLSSKHSDKIRLAARFVSVCNLEPSRVSCSFNAVTFLMRTQSL